MRKLAIALAVFAGVLAGAPSAFAVTLGVAVDGLGSNTGVGTTVTDAANPLAAVGFDAIKYYIPLTSEPPATCTYGAGCGTIADSGIGGTVMSMFMRFDPVSTSVSSVMEVYFEDLDLISANDPAGFLESLEIFNASGTSLTGPITDINGIILNGIITGNASTQQLLSLALGVVGNPFFAEFKFAASSSFYGTNTPEFLIATVRDCIVGVDSLCPPGQTAIPLPAAFPLFATALGGMGRLGWRRRRKAAAAV